VAEGGAEVRGFKMSVVYGWTTQRSQQQHHGGRWGEHFTLAVVCGYHGWAIQRQLPVPVTGIVTLV